MNFRKLMFLIRLMIMLLILDISVDASSISESAGRLLEDIRKALNNPPEKVSIVHVEQCVKGQLNDCIASCVENAKKEALQQGVRQFIDKLNKQHIQILGISGLLNRETTGKWVGNPVIQESISVDHQRITIKAEGTVAIVLSSQVPVMLEMLQADAVPGNQPPSMIRLGNFCIDRTEVSIKEFKTVFPDYQPPNSQYSDDMPVVNISFNEAEVFAKATGNRLCTETEWLTALGTEVNLEKAVLKAGGPGDVPYEASDESDKNIFGLLNMVGNVSEWVYANGRPAYIGGWWFLYMENDLTEESIRKVNIVKAKDEKKISIGFRRCRDCGK